MNNHGYLGDMSDKVYPVSYHLQHSISCKDMFDGDRIHVLDEYSMVGTIPFFKQTAEI